MYRHFVKGGGVFRKVGTACGIKEGASSHIPVL